MLKILKMAWRSWLGYRLKAVSLFIFTSISFTVVLLGVDVLYNSFNISFDSATATYMPRFFVCGEKDYDFDQEYGIGDLSVPAGSREKLEKSLGEDFRIDEGAFFWSALTDPESSEQMGWSFVTGVDLAAIGEIFPALAGKLSAEEVASIKGGPFAIANQKLKANLELAQTKYCRSFSKSECCNHKSNCN